MNATLRRTQARKRIAVATAATGAAALAATGTMIIALDANASVPQKATTTPTTVAQQQTQTDQTQPDQTRPDQTQTDQTQGQQAQLNPFSGQNGFSGGGPSGTNNGPMASSGGS